MPPPLSAPASFSMHTCVSLRPKALCLCISVLGPQNESHKEGPPTLVQGWDP